MASQHFTNYVTNINRINLVEMIESFSIERRASFRASLIANPVTGVPYPLAAAGNDGDREEPISN